MSLEWEYLREVFPFAFRWNNAQELIFAGRSLRRACTWIEPGMTVKGLFEMHRPNGAFEAAWLAQNQGKLLLVREVRSGMMMRGQVMVEAGGAGLFLGTPWVSAPDDLDRLGLTLSDFTVSNATASNLSGSGAAYSITLTPVASGVVTVSLPAGAAQNAAATGSTASNVVSVTYTVPATVAFVGQDVG